MKTCTRCRVEQSLDRFAKSTRNATGLQPQCRQCLATAQRDYKARNPGRAAEYQKRYLDANPGNRKNSLDAYQKTDKFRATVKRYRTRHAGKVNASTARRHAQKICATPAWLTPDDLAYIQALYEVAADLGHHVDHYVPLRHPLVCGLHVPWNLQILTPDENRKKNNTFHVG